MIDSIVVTQNKMCKDERDRIYGILGMVDHISMIPTYRDTTHNDIALMVTEECVNNLKQMDLLHTKGPKIAYDGARMVLSWLGLKSPKPVIGRICHQGNCSYKRNIGLTILKPKVCKASVVATVENTHTSVKSCIENLKTCMEHKDLILLVRGILYSNMSIGYWDERMAIAMLNIWNEISIAPEGTTMETILGQHNMKIEEYIWNTLDTLLVSEPQRLYIIRIGTCYISTVIHDINFPIENLIAVDYGGTFAPQFADIEAPYRGDRLPLIIAELIENGKARFISSIIQEKSIFANIAESDAILVL